MECEKIVYVPVSDQAVGNLRHRVLPALCPSVDCVSSQGILEDDGATGRLGPCMSQAPHLPPFQSRPTLDGYKARNKLLCLATGIVFFAFICLFE